MKFKDSFHPYAACTVLCWSLSYVLTRLTLDYFSATSLAFLRYIIASATLAVIAAVRKMKRPERRDLPVFFVSGAVGFFLYMIAFNLGQAAVTAATASVVVATVPVVTALMARVIFGERLRGYQWAAIGVEFAGVAVLFLLDGVFSVNAGLLWLLAAVVTLSAYNLIQRKLIRRYTSLQASTYSIYFGTLLLAIFAPAAFRQALQAPPIQFLYLGIMGVLPSAIAYILWAEAFAKAKQTSQVSNYMFLTPFLASTLGFLIIGEVPDRPTVLGGGIILLGVLIFNFGGLLRPNAAGREH